MKLKLLSVFLVGLVVGLGLSQFQSLSPLGAQSNFSGPLNSLAGYQESGTEVIDTNGAFVGTVSSTAVQRLSGEISLAGDICGTASYAIPAIPGIGTVTAGQNVVTTTVSLAGLAIGDLAIVSWQPASATGTLFGSGLTASVEASSSVAVVSFVNHLVGSSTAINAGTIRVCYFD